MANDLVLVEQALSPLIPSFMQVLPKELPPERIIRTVLVSCEMNKYLLECDRGSLLRAAMTAAVLGLEVDGVTGQGYLVPFKGKVQFLPGYKGMVTIAARSGRTLEGFIVRDQDAFAFDEANGTVRHQKALGGEKQRRVVAAYAVSRGEGVPTMVRVMSLDEIIAVRDRSAGYRASPERSPWATDFDAMARKCPIRMLAKDIPNISLQAAAALDTHHDLGRETYIRQDRAVIVDGAPTPIEQQPISTGPAGLTDKTSPRAKLMASLHDTALEGPEALKDAWTSLTASERKIIGEAGKEELKALAEKQGAAS